MSAATTGVRIFRVVLVGSLLAQAGAGGLGFGLFPEEVLGVPVDAVARLGFRLAGATNLAAAAFGLWVVARRDLAAQRVLALCLAGYHALAGAEAVHHVVSNDALAAVGGSAGPFHVVSAVALLGAAAWARERG